MRDDDYFDEWDDDMNDEEFRREFLRMMLNQQRRYDSYLSGMFGNQYNTFGSGMDNLDLLKLMMGIDPSNISSEGGVDENGEWESNTWESPDGSTRFRSFKRYGFNGPNKGRREEENVNTVKLLESKLKKAVALEEYEEAQKIKDLIDSLKKEENDKKDQK